MTTCSIDFETRSTVDLKATGVYPYAGDSTTDLWCFAYAFDEEPVVSVWRPGLPFPERLATHITAGGEMRAWNAQFERVIWRDLGIPRYGFPTVPDGQWVCTAAEAAAMALPRSLEQCATVLRLPVQKDQAGYRLMMQMARPRRWDSRTLIWWEEPEKRARLEAYCQQDVVVERRIAHAVRRLSAEERGYYLLDQRINDRGVRIDRPLIVAMQGMAERALRRSGEQLTALTGGMVGATSQVGRMKTWLAQQGVTVESLAKKPIADLLAGECSDLVREVLEIRAETAKSSVAKLVSMVACADAADDKIRGMLLYHGASTGRWSGRLVQPHNFPRPMITQVETLLPYLQQGRDGVLDLLHPVLEVISASLRSCLIASPGCRLVAADYAGIEARITNWLAGQWDIVDVFARGESVYLHNAKQLAILNGVPLPPTASKSSHPADYQIGKIIELGCGFGMGPAKFQTTAREQHDTLLTDAQAAQFVDFYRTSHHRVTSLWRQLNQACLRAVDEPGTVTMAGEGAAIRFTRRGGYLWMILPSGRPLAYAEPHIEEREAPWSTPEQPARTRSVVASGVNSQTRRWDEFFLYGGLLLENAVQAIARDLMAHGMQRVDAAGYPVVLTVHDEVVADVPAGQGTLAEFQQLLVERPAWALARPGGRDLPLDTEGWDGHRYRK